MARLTAVKVKALSESGRYGDGDGLYLTVRKGGSKSWILRLSAASRNGKRTDKGLGGFPAVSLAAARRKAQDLRAAADEGRAPEPRKDVPTFGAVADQYIEANAPTWRHPKTAKDMRARLDKYAGALLDKRIDRIRRPDVLRVLLPIWTAKPAAAKKLRQRIRAVFMFAMAHEWIDENPAGEAIEKGLPKTKAVKAHFRALPYEDVVDALRTVDGGRACAAVKRCLRFLVLTAARSGEARGATWDEIDLDAATWTIPADRMKANREHRVPLSDAALDVLRAVGPQHEGLIFPSPRRRGQLSDMALTKVLRDSGLAGRATVHGFRTSFKTWCMEQTLTPWAVGEAALAHTLGDSTAQAYARSDMVERRRQLMQEWADYIAGGAA